MPWKRSEVPETVLASRALVDEFYTMDKVPYERKLSERRIDVYTRILNNREFRPVTWASVACRETGNTYRVNGQHTATMLHRIDGKLPELFVTVERYVADTLHDVGSLYNTFDSGAASRTTGDINMAFAATVPELSGIQSRFINLVVSAASFHQWSEQELRKVPQAERAELILENISFAKWLADIIPGGKGRKHVANRILCRAPVINAMMITYRSKPRIATDFWEAVRDETEDQGTPTRLLARYLLTSVLSGGRSGGKTGAGADKIASSREMYAKSIHAWNAWRAGEPTTLRYVATAPVPKVAG